MKVPIKIYTSDETFSEFKAKCNIVALPVGDICVFFDVSLNVILWFSLPFLVSLDNILFYQGSNY